jgi:sugar phosphate isomerase/epimerase
MSAEFRLGIQSYCFRKFQPLSALIDCLKQVGLQYVEVWPGHLDHNAGADAVRKGLNALKDAGITIDSYGVVGVGADEAADRALFEFARLAGLRAFSIGGLKDDAIDVVESLCEEYSINVAIHNHGRRHEFGSFDVLEDLFDRTSSRIGLCMDTAWALDSDEDPVAGVDRFGDRLYGVHLKDFVFEADHKPKDVIIGAGGLDLPAYLDALDSVGFDGYMSLEYEGNADDPMDEVMACMQVVKKAAGA